MNKVINLKGKAAKLNELWSPRVVGELDNAYYAKIAKLKGDLAWHSHEEKDGLFFIIEGKLKIELEDQTIELSEGDMYIAPRESCTTPLPKKNAVFWSLRRKRLNTSAMLRKTKLDQSRIS